MPTFKELTDDLKKKLDVYKSQKVFHTQPQKVQHGTEDLSTLWEGITDEIPKERLYVGVSGPSQESPISHGQGSSEQITKSDLGLAVEKCLQKAVSLEFATIPPYLTALWSIKDQQSEVAKSLRSVVHEEMLHMAYINNIVSAIGVKPNLKAVVPDYPCKLPGGLHPDLDVELLPLDKDQIGVFAEIESPEEFVDIEDEPTPPPNTEGETIGKFYEIVKSVIVELNPNFRTIDQIAGPLVPNVIDSMASFEAAVDVIVTQGEGGNALPYYIKPENLAHYYRFREMEIGYKLVWDPADKKLVKGNQTSLPEVFKFQPAPTGGYGKGFTQAVQDLSLQFTTIYTDMILELEAAWTGDGHSSLLRAIEAMFDLKPIAIKLMEKGYGPPFELVSK